VLDLPPFPINGDGTPLSPEDLSAMIARMNESLKNREHAQTGSPSKSDIMLEEVNA
jgi:hypothetical protein